MVGRPIHHIEGDSVSVNKSIQLRVTIPAMLFALFIGTSPALSAEPNRWEPAIAQFESLDAANPPSPGAILFIGSSSIRMWKTLAKDMAPMRVMNRGFGGSGIGDAVQYADRIVFSYRPSKIVFYSGENDIAAGQTPKQVSATFKQFAELVGGKLPGVPIYYVAMKPSVLRWEMWNDMREGNRLIADYCASRPGLTFVDVSAAMMDPSGVVRTDIFIKDNLHMNAAGYAVWTGIIRPLLLKDGGSGPAK